MSTIIRFAKTTSELRDVLEVRFRAMEQGARRLPHIFALTQTIIDQYDIYPTTQNVVAYSQGQAVAAARMVEYAPGRNLLNQSFDFSESFTKIKGSAAYLDMLVVMQEIAGNESAKTQLIRMALNHLALKGVDHAFFVCPDSLLGLTNKIGFKPVADSFECEFLRLRVTPVTIDSGAANPGSACLKMTFAV